MPDLAQAICALACEEVEGEAPGEDVPSAEEEGDASDDPLLVARDALSTLSAGLPAKTIAPPVMAFSRQACAAHMPERTRRAGVVVLASLAEVRAGARREGCRYCW